MKHYTITFGQKGGYHVYCSFDKWKTSHCAVELCETAILRRERLRGARLNKQQELNKHFFIHYKNCRSQLNPHRLNFYKGDFYVTTEP